MQLGKMKQKIDRISLLKIKYFCLLYSVSVMLFTCSLRIPSYGVRNNIKNQYRIRVMVINATFNNISVILWWSVFLVEETRVPGENHGPAASH
jgi:hypothetical protein